MYISISHFAYSTSSYQSLPLHIFNLGRSHKLLVSPCIWQLSIKINTILHTQKILQLIILLTTIIYSKGYSHMARPLFLRRGIITFSISALYEKESCSYTSISLLVSTTCTHASGMLGINYLPIKHRCLYIFFIRNNSVFKQVRK